MITTSAYQIDDGKISVNHLALEKALKPYATPFYFYNLDHVRARAGLLTSAFSEAANLPTTIHYAMKANANPTLLKMLRDCKLKVDVVSGGEADCAISNGFTAKDILFSGVAKTSNELKNAISAGYDQINVESLGELERLESLALEMNWKNPISIGLRLNPNVSPETHPYITTGLRENKFGLEEEAINEAVAHITKSRAPIFLRGLSLHIGSQLLDLDALDDALAIAIELQRKIVEKMKGITLGTQLNRFDAGGGIGINYETENEQAECAFIFDYANLLKKHLQPEFSAGRLERLLIEPGRWLVARSGLVVTEVQYTKTTQHKSFAIVDGGMNMLIRPALYQAEHRILPLVERVDEAISTFDVVGPICESADFLGRNRSLKSLKSGDRLAVFDAGAYGRTMASNYNQRGWPAEYVLQNGQIFRSDSK